MPYPCGCSGSDCVVDFTWAITSGTTVQFTDASVDAVSWLWTFRIGQTSTVQNPSFNFGAPGVYPVSLQITNATGQQCTRIQTVTVNLPCGVCIDTPGISASVTLGALSDNRCTYCEELAGTYILTKISACNYEYREQLGLCFICDLGEPEKSIELVMTLTIAGGFGANPATMSLRIVREFNVAAEDPCPTAQTDYRKSFGTSSAITCTGSHTLDRLGVQGPDRADCNDWPATLAVTLA